MNKVILSTVFVLSLVVNVWAESIKADSKITSVTVYPDSALITRSVKVDLTPGMHEVVLENVIPSIDDNSLTVSGAGTGEFKLHGAMIKWDYLTEPPSERVKELTKQIQDIVDQMSSENNKLQTIDAQKNFLKSIQLYSGQQIPKELVTKTPSTQDLEGLLNFIGTQGTALEDKRQEINSKIRELVKQKEALDKQLMELRHNPNNAKRMIVASVECVKKGNLTLNISFLAHGTFWYPVYDARADLVKDQVELSTYGVVKQTTGEDWNDVEISLSTAKPSISGQLPYVAPWILRPFQPRPAVAQAMGVMGRLKSAADDIGDQSLQYEPYYLSTNGAVAKEAKAEVAFSQANFKGVSVSYQLPGKATIKSDGTEQKLPISIQTLSAKYSYSAYPRASSFAYLGSRVTNSKDLQLLAGQVNIFLDGDYVGKSNIQNIGPGEEFDLFLGVDENVKVERKEIEKRIDETLIAGIASPNRKTIFKYNISVENYKPKPIDVILYEATPVSENDRIKTKVADVSVEPKEKDWNNRKGVWRWELKLNPKAKQDIQYTYIIEHPREMQVEGM